MLRKCHRCGYPYPDELGRYGCPNCHGDGLCGASQKDCAPLLKVTGYYGLLLPQSRWARRETKMQDGVLKSKEVLHRSDTRGVVMSRWEVVRVDDTYHIAEFWSQWETGKLVRVGSREITEANAMALVQAA